MKTEQELKATLPTSALEVLERTSEEFNQLERSNRKVAYRNLTVDQYREALIERTENIIGLPERLLELIERDIEVSLEVITKAIEFSQKAREALKTNSAKAMHNLLMPEIHREGDINELDQLIESLQNS